MAIGRVGSLLEKEASRLTAGKQEELWAALIKLKPQSPAGSPRAQGKPDYAGILPAAEYVYPNYTFWK